MMWFKEMSEYLKSIKKLNEQFMYCIYAFTAIVYTAYLRYVFMLMTQNVIPGLFGFYFAATSGFAVGIALLLIVTKNQDNFLLIINEIIHFLIILGKLIFVFMNLSVFWNRTFVSLALSICLFIIFTWRLKLSILRHNII